MKKASPYFKIRSWSALLVVWIKLDGEKKVGRWEAFGIHREGRVMKIMKKNWWVRQLKAGGVIRTHPDLPKMNIKCLDSFHFQTNNNLTRYCLRNNNHRKNKSTLTCYKRIWKWLKEIRLRIMVHFLTRKNKVEIKKFTSVTILT